MSCLGRAAVPVKRVWRGLSARLRRRRTTVKSSSSYVPMNRGSDDRPDDDGDMAVAVMRKEVCTCEYSDVHVMWEMLSNTTIGGGGYMSDIDAAGKGDEADEEGRKPVAWSQLLSYCCGL